jgi:hypothetical protein
VLIARLFHQQRPAGDSPPPKQEALDARRAPVVPPVGAHPLVCALEVRHGGLNGTTWSECRGDCCRKRSGASIAANIRTARRERPSRVASVRQDPNSAVPDAYLTYLPKSQSVSALSPWHSQRVGNCHLKIKRASISSCGFCPRPELPTPC